MVCATYILPVLFSIIFTNTASALQCYDCDSSKNVACTYGLLSFTQNVKECSADGGFLGGILPSSCNKIVAIDKEGNEFIARGCIINTGPIPTCQAMAKVMQFAAADKELQSINCYTCDTDKCNGAASLGGLTVVGMLTACLLYLLL